MKLFILVVLSFFICVGSNAQTWEPSSGHEQVSIWPKGKMPDPISPTQPETVTTYDNPVAGKPVTLVLDVSNPTITIYPPAIKNTGAAVVVFPGGGFHGLAMDLEGTEIAEWLSSKGITGILLNSIP